MITTPPNIIVNVSAKNYSTPWTLFLIMEVPRIIEESITTENPVLITISNTEVYIRVIGYTDKQEISSMYNSIITKILSNKDYYERTYSIKITPDALFNTIIFE